MKQLIISVTDFYFSCGVTILENNEIKSSFNNHNTSELEQYGLTKDAMTIDCDLINPSNKAIKEFDNIILCEDGKVKIFMKGEDY
jgi:hypothetical protein